MKLRLAVFPLILMAFACGGSDGNEAAVEDGVQVVQVSVQDANYIFSPPNVQAAHPVRLVFDPGNLPGCSKSVTIPAFAIEKEVVEGDATIEFTPTAEGPIEVACSMNMYTGTLVAEQ